jgi:hypothetical protein
MGLPHESPDIYGMAVRVPLPQNVSGDQPSADLLFASTGETAYGRFVLKLRPAAAHGPLTTLLPVRAPAGPLLLRLRPKGGTRAGTGRGDLSRPDRMTLSYAVGTGGWTDVATVDLGARLPTERDGARYDPIAKNLPGTQQYDVVRRLREPAYLAARRVRSQG